MDDNSIIELYWQRDQSAVSCTAEKYGGMCSRIAVNILGSAQDAEECVNDTWMRAWNAIPPQRPAHLPAWLGRITRNLSLNRLSERKAEKRGSGQVILALHELEECVSGSEQELSDGRAIITAINAFLRNERQRDRALFVLRYWQLEPVDAIARRFGLSQSNVTTILFRMRKRLRTYLEREGVSI